MLTEGQIQEFQRDGFLLGGRVISDSEADELSSEVERVISRRDQALPQPVMLHNMTGKPDSTIWQIVNIWEVSPAFERLVRHPVITEETALLAGAQELRVWHDQIQYKPRGEGGVNMWHQDWPYWGILSGPHQVTAWVALDDADEENGCMKMVKGSHLWGDQIEFLHTLKAFEAMPGEFQKRKTEVLLRPVKKGNVHYHHALTWHGSGANKSGRPRRAIGIHYMTEKTLYLKNGDHPMKPFVPVEDGAAISGSHFPLVWRRI